jgi:hypothetical protein
MGRFSSGVAFPCGNGFQNQNSRFILKPRIFAKTGSGQTQEKMSKKSTVFSMQGIEGPEGHCGVGGIREYNFCAGLALLWLRGGE